MIIILAFVVFGCHCGSIEITVETDISADKEIDPQKEIIQHKEVNYDQVKVPEPLPNTVVNKDIYGFLKKLRKVNQKGLKKNAPKKPIFRSAITLIANSAQKDYKFGTRKKVSKVVPKMYMPIPQAISHILGKEHIPYGVYEDLRHSYSYKSR